MEKISFQFYLLSGSLTAGWGLPLIPTLIELAPAHTAPVLATELSADIRAVDTATRRLRRTIKGTQEWLKKQRTGGLNL
jgi:hypothetical protein